MSVPHWVLWVAGIQRIESRDLIIRQLGLTNVTTFTFIKEDSVVRMGKTLRKTHHVHLSEAEMLMIWTAIKIVQSALIQGKPITPDTIKSLVTVEEIIRVHHMNEINKSTDSTVDDI